MPDEDLIELKFRLFDGSDIGPIRYSSTSTVAMLKDRIISEWPRDKKIIPEVANDVKLISAGKILENNMTVAQCASSPFSELPAGVITMHVVVQPSSTKTKTDMLVISGRRILLKHLCDRISSNTCNEDKLVVVN
ncbi:membrane-anchored ubiquitin-fold protein 4 isoform X1 [Musa acuminata AAA Group]|uniref:membrane-anchored ubiquitin-fold protein 4 isoform X1 n=1 Tax=Musa acuminata AAA Group TaxID=214697 RepID=UPI0031E1CC90